MLKRLVGLFAAALLQTNSVPAAEPGPLAATFDAIRTNAMGEYGVYTLKNVSGKDIDDIEIILRLQDKSGETLSVTAVSDSTPGVVWLKAGATLKEGVPLDGRRGAQELLEKRLGESRLVIEVKSIKFAN